MSRAAEPRRPVPPRKPAAAFREAIEKAELEGVSREDMLLNLTLGDASDLKRDRTVAVEDISFSGGAMRYLGVRVVEGGVSQSSLATAPA